MMNTLIGSTSRVALWLLLLGTIWAQQPTGSLQGTVLDESGAVIPGAKVEVVRNQKIAWQLPSDSLGNFSFLGLAPGEYLVRVDANGFNTFESSPQKVTAGNVITLAVALDVLTASEQVTVTSDQSGTVTLEASENANAVVLRGADLDTLPDDPEERMDDLQALAGPPVGSGGNQVYLDGFSPQRLPPKNAIREVRINQDPFSAQYDHVGFGRVEIFTKPVAL